MAKFLKDEDYVFAGICGAVVFTGKEEGLINYKYSPTGEKIKADGKEDKSGNIIPKIKNSNKADFVLTVMAGSEIEEKINLARMQNALFIGTYVDKSSSTQIKTFNISAGFDNSEMGDEASEFDITLKGNIKKVMIPT